MWKWTCEKSPNVVNEHHSWIDLDELLTAHEDGFSIPGGRVFPPCDAIHDFWNDHVPCSWKNCKIPFVDFG